MNINNFKKASKNNRIYTKALNNIKNLKAMLSRGNIKMPQSKDDMLNEDIDVARLKIKLEECVYELCNGNDFSTCQVESKARSKYKCTLVKSYNIDSLIKFDLDILDYVSSNELHDFINKNVITEINSQYEQIHNDDIELPLLQLSLSENNSVIKLNIEIEDRKIAPRLLEN